VILKLFIIGPGGILYYSKSFFSHIEVDEGVLSGFLAAFSDFANEIKGGEVKALIFREFNFIYSYSSEFKLMFIIVTDTIGLEEEVKRKVDLMKKEFIKRYKPQLENWSGNISIFREFDKFIEEKVFIPPKILITGELGVGKTTIMNLFSEELVVELDDDLNQILKKTIKIKNLDVVNEFTIQEIDLNDIVNNFSVYKDLLNAIDLVLIITNSGASNLGRTQDLILKLKPKIKNTEIFLIANFQDLEDIAFKPQQIEDNLKIKTFGLSAIEDGAKKEIESIFSDLIKKSILKMQKKTKLEISEIITE